MVETEQQLLQPLDPSEASFQDICFNIVQSKNNTPMSYIFTAKLYCPLKT